jgi:hypothetical protein
LVFVGKDGFFMEVVIEGWVCVPLVSW